MQQANSSSQRPRRPQQAGDNNGIACFIDAQHAIAHNKVMVIDGQTVITGSFNFTKAAEDNADYLLVVLDADMLPSTHRTGASTRNIRSRIPGCRAMTSRSRAKEIVNGGR